MPLLDIHPAPEATQHDTMQAVLALPLKYRVVVHLYYYEGYSSKEIAEITAQKELAVRQLLTRARRKLKVFWKGKPYEGIQGIHEHTKGWSGIA